MIRFKEWNCEVVKAKYGNGRTAIRLVDADNGEPIATATVNIPEIPLPKNEVIIKDYSENEGILDALINAGIVELTGRRIKGGYVDMPICILK